MIRIAIAQINPTVGDLQGNTEKVSRYVQLAKDKQADIVVFPELSLCGYPPEDLLYKEAFVSDQLAALNALKRDIKGIAAIIGFVDRDKSKGLYNAAAVIYNGGIKGIYRKEQLPNYGVFDEKRYFHPGVNNKIFSLGGIGFAVNICEDIWVDKDGVCERQVKMGAKLLINISSSPYDVDKLKIREALVKKRAKATKAYICYANLVGGQDELVFDGSSFIVDPKGNIIAAAKQFEEDLLVCDLNIAPGGKGKKPAIIDLGQTLAASKKTSVTGLLAKQYSQDERIYKALVLGTADYIRKNGFQKVLIGLSGGIDSALVAVIAVDAVGKENVVGVSMPSRYSSEGTKTDARQLAKNLGIAFQEIPMDEVFDVYLKTMASPFAGTKPNIAEENIQARIRGNILMALSNKFGWLVLTTGNKSEIAVGYCTLYGDMSGGFAVIKDVPKTKVYDLAKLRCQNRKGLIPETIFTRPPTAELRENQRDQDTLPPYDVLDQILTQYVEQHHSPAHIAAGKDKETVRRVIHMVDQSEYKRRQAPPGVKITPRAFGKDWRLPITNRYKGF